MELGLDFVHLALEYLISRYRFPTIAQQLDRLFELTVDLLSRTLTRFHPFLAIYFLAMTPFIAVAELAADIARRPWLHLFSYFIEVVRVARSKTIILLVL